MDKGLGTTNAPNVNLVSSIRPRMKSKGLVAVDISEPPHVVGDVDARIFEGIVRCRLLCDQVVLVGDLHRRLCGCRRVDRLTSPVDTSSPPCLLVAPTATVVEAQEVRVGRHG